MTDEKEKKAETAKSEIALSAKLQKIASEIEKLTVVELSELAKSLEEKFEKT